METITPDSVWPAIVASAASLTVGGIAVHFKLFIESEGEFRNRVQLLRETQTENFARKLAALLRHVHSMTDDDLLRGDGQEESDLVGETAKECRKMTMALHRMGFVRDVVRVAYFLIFAAMVLAMFGVFVAWQWEAAREYVLWGSIGLLVFQIAVVYVVMRASHILENLEDD